MFFFIFLIFADYVGVIVDATILTRTSICILQEATTFTHYIILLYITYWQYLSKLSVLSRVSLVSMLVISTSIRVMMSLLPMCTRYQVQVSVNVMGTPCLHADCQLSTLKLCENWQNWQNYTPTSTNLALTPTLKWSILVWRQILVRVSKYPSEF